MFPITCEEIVSNVRDSFAAIHHPQSRNISFPRIWPFHQGSLVDALFATTTRACVCVSSFPRSFSSLRIVSRTIEYPAWVVEPARIVFLEKALPFLRCYFLFAPFKSVNEGTRKLAFVDAANSKGRCVNAFLYAPLFMTGLPLWIISEWRHLKLLVYSWIIQKVWFFWNL